MLLVFCEVTQLSTPPLLGCCYDAIVIQTHVFKTIEVPFVIFVSFIVSNDAMPKFQYYRKKRPNS